MELRERQGPGDPEPPPDPEPGIGSLPLPEPSPAKTDVVGGLGERLGGGGLGERLGGGRLGEGMIPIGSFDEATHDGLTRMQEPVTETSANSAEPVGTAPNRLLDNIMPESLGTEPAGTSSAGIETEPSETTIVPSAISTAPSRLLPMAALTGQGSPRRAA